jgi:hypothetical protein
MWLYKNSRLKRVQSSLLANPSILPFHNSTITLLVAPTRQSCAVIMIIWWDLIPQYQYDVLSTSSLSMSSFFPQVNRKRKSNLLYPHCIHVQVERTPSSYLRSVRIRLTAKVVFMVVLFIFIFPKLYVEDRVWYQMKACKILSSFIIRKIRNIIRNSSTWERAVPKLYVGDILWYQMIACKNLSSCIVREIRNSIRNSSTRERVVLKLWVRVRVWSPLQASNILSRFIIREIRKSIPNSSTRERVVLKIWGMSSCLVSIES